MPSSTTSLNWGESALFGGNSQNSYANNHHHQKWDNSLEYNLKGHLFSYTFDNIHIYAYRWGIDKN